MSQMSGSELSLVSRPTNDYMAYAHMHQDKNLVTFFQVMVKEKTGSDKNNQRKAAWL